MEGTYLSHENHDRTENIHYAKQFIIIKSISTKNFILSTTIIYYSSIYYLKKWKRYIQKLNRKRYYI